MKTKKIFFGLSILMVIMHTTTVLAASKTYYSVSTDYGSGEHGGSGIPEATFVSGRLNLEGYSGALNIKPTYSNLNATYQGKKVMESSILYFLGHGSSNSILWNYKYSGGNYATGIGIKTNDYYSGNYHIRGIGTYNLNNVKLAVFQGCNTASNTNNNLPKYAVNKGATAAIGWSVEIHRNDTYPWTSRFFTKQFGRATIASQVEYANSFSYTTSAIKNTRLYGNTNTNFLSNNYNIEKSNQFLTVDNRRYIVNTSINLNNMELEIIKKELITLINEKLNIKNSYDDFIIEKAVDGTHIIYDLYFTVGGARTKLTYTVFVNMSNDYITDIYDNTDGYKLEEIKNNANKFALQKKMVENDNVLNTSINDDFSGDVVGKFNFYDVNTNKYYKVIQYKVKASSENYEYSIVDNYIEL